MIKLIEVNEETLTVNDQLTNRNWVTFYLNVGTIPRKERDYS